MPIRITSLHNPRVKAVIALRDARERRRRNQIIIDGIREIRRANEAGIPFQGVFFCPTLLGPQCSQLLKQIVGPQTELFEVTSRVFEQMSFGERRDGIIAVASAPQRALAELEAPDGSPLIAILEGIEKPGNVGAIVRSADGAGLTGVIAADLRTDLYNPNAIRASVGTLFSMPVVATEGPIARRWVTTHNLQVVAAKVGGNVLYDHVDFTQPTAIVLGNEASGLTTLWDQPEVIGVRIPMLGMADSLNVSVAAAILFYEAQRQRRLAKTKA